MIAYLYHAEMEEGHVGPECPTIAQAMEGFSDGDQTVKVLDDWQDNTTSEGKPCETATVTFHDRPCGILVRVKAEA